MGSFVMSRIASYVLLFFAVTLLVFVAFFVMPRSDSRFGRRARLAELAACRCRRECPVIDGILARGRRP